MKQKIYETTYKFTPLVLRTEIRGNPELFEEMMKKVYTQIEKFLIFFETESGMVVTSKFDKVK